MTFPAVVRAAAAVIASDASLARASATVLSVMEQSAVEYMRPGYAKGAVAAPGGKRRKMSNASNARTGFKLATR